MEGQPPIEHGLSEQLVDAESVGQLYIGDVHALRRAEAVEFHTGDGRSWIRACLQGQSMGESRIYTAKEQRLFPDADALDRCRTITVGGDIAGFDEQHRWHGRTLPGTSAFTSINPAWFDERWRTIVALLRVGDVVHLSWQADNIIDQLGVAGLHRDELSIDVRRGQRSWTFLAEVQIRPDPVRMISRSLG